MRTMVPSLGIGWIRGMHGTHTHTHNRRQLVFNRAHSHLGTLFALHFLHNVFPYEDFSRPRRETCHIGLGCG